MDGRMYDGVMDHDDGGSSGGKGEEEKRVDSRNRPIRPPIVTLRLGRRVMGDKAVPSSSLFPPPPPPPSLPRSPYYKVK